MGFKKSSKSISPGCTGAISLFNYLSPSMIIYNFNIISINVLPLETNSPLIVYADAPVTTPVSRRLFKPV
jgi:hypothetical protein